MKYKETKRNSDQTLGKSDPCAETLALDLWSLASTSIILGSASSTFGYLAAAVGIQKKLFYIKSCDGTLTQGRMPSEMVEDPTTHEDELTFQRTAARSVMLTRHRHTAVHVTHAESSQRHAPRRATS